MAWSNQEIQKGAADLLQVVRSSENEEQFKIAAENILKTLCEKNNVFWNPYSYEHSFSAKKRRIDAVHGSTILEYEPPLSFKKTANSQLRHARQQAEEYAGLLSDEEGRSLESYSLVVWDGESISFGSASGKAFHWEPVRDFDELCLKRLLNLIADGGRPLVSPTLINQFAGPETDIGRGLLPLLFRAIIKAQSTPSSRTHLIYAEWLRLFGQVDGTQTERLIEHLGEISRSHDTAYGKAPQAYFFALSTYIALVAKICAVYALASQSTIVESSIPDAKAFLRNVEDGGCFRQYGIENMLGSDFFSWYLGDDVSEDLTKPLGELLERLRTFDFNIAKKSADSVRDLFKGLYMEFIPSPLRHALGEYYTPDWLASHVLDVADWQPHQSLLDPTCGSGTFILEALKRRLTKVPKNAGAGELLSGLYGTDLNPLAVLTAKASIVVFLSSRFKASAPVLLPVFLADAINTADPIDGVFRHSILTEKGERTFAVPATLAKDPAFFHIMDHLRVTIDAGLSSQTVLSSLQQVFKAVKELDDKNQKILSDTVENLVDLHCNHWNGIWCLILFDRIMAGNIHNIDCVAGNPPWVKWSHLPRSYAEFIKPICDRMAIFSDDAWVGGIQSDISTVVTYRALERFLKFGGTLAFLITGTVFKNESSQGFRRWTLKGSEQDEPMSVSVVEDYSSLKPFEGVSNQPTLLVIRRNGQPTKYPVKYRTYARNRSKLPSVQLASYQDFLAMPVPGTDAGPWLVGNKTDLALWPRLFQSSETSQWRARKGITTDANGIYFVTAAKTVDSKFVTIANDPGNGRNQAIPAYFETVESDDIFPLLRGRDVQRFQACPTPGQAVIVPQRGMFGDETLPATRPRLFRLLTRFRDILEKRSSYSRFQKGKAPFWSIWSTGNYTFAPYKVVWKEMSGKDFCAAYVHDAAFLNEKKLIIPDHKVYFVPLETEEEAAYLTAFLNARIVSSAVNAYSSALSLGTSVTDYLRIPPFDKADPTICEMVAMAKRFHEGEKPTDKDETRLDALVESLLRKAVGEQT